MKTGITSKVSNMTVQVNNIVGKAPKKRASEQGKEIAPSHLLMHIIILCIHTFISTDPKQSRILERAKQYIKLRRERLNK